MASDVIDWLQGECLGQCSEQKFFMNGRALDQQKQYMNPDQYFRQREIEAEARRKMSRCINSSARRHFDSQ